MEENTTGQHAPDSSNNQHSSDNTTLMAVLAYIGPLILVSFLLAKDEPFVKFHLRQGLLLVIAEIASWMIALLFWPMWPLMQIVNIVVLVLAVVGIIRASQGQMKELPFIGHLAKHINV